MIRNLSSRALTRIVTAGIVSALSFAQACAEEAAADDASQVMEMAATVTDAELDSSRGAFLPDTLPLSSVEQSAQDKGNVVIGGFTGANVIGNGSFSNTQGLVNVIQNTGNNVVIQSSTVVNLTFNK